MIFRTLHVVALIGMVVGLFGPAFAQPADTIRERVNAGRVGVISGGVNGTYIRIAADLAAVLDDQDDLRVLPIVGKGSVQNITDLLYLRGIDIAIVQSDVLAFMKNENIHPTIEQRVRYITKLYNEEFHLLAGEAVQTVADLAGKPVNFDVSGSGTNMTAGTVFRLLGIDVEPTTFDQALALEKLKAGEIAAMVYVAGKPTRLYESLDRAEGLHFVPIPMTPDLLETYLPTRLEHTDYPRLVPEGEAVETVAVGAVMAVYNWPSGQQRHGYITTFVNAFFGAFDRFQEAPRHPKWREVNLAAQVPGWQRFQAAERWLEANVRPETLVTQAGPGAEDRQSFEQFVEFFREQAGSQSGTPLSAEEREALFAEFLKWRARFQQ